MANITKENNLKHGYFDWSKKIAFFQDSTLVHDPRIEEKLNNSNLDSEYKTINPDDIKYFSEPA